MVFIQSMVYMAFSKLKFPPSILIILLFGFVLFSLQLMSSATQESSQLNEMYSWLLLVNILGSVILLILIGVNIFSLIWQLKTEKPGPD